MLHYIQVVLIAKASF